MSKNNQLVAAKKGWEKLAQKDPLWAILSDNSKKNNKWDVEAFFETGPKDIQKIITILKELKIPINYDSALDFGCGVGRLSQSLSRYFNKVYGVDISPKMIQLANQYNTFDHCQYFINNTDDLSIFSKKKFSFILSLLTFQHIPVSITKKYLKECLGLLADDGILIFQMPSQPKFQFSSKLSFLNQLLPQICINPAIQNIHINRLILHWIKRDLYVLPAKEIYSIFESSRVHSINLDNNEFYDHLYIIQK